MGKTGKKILGAIVAVAAIVFTGGTAALAYIGKALVTAAVSIGISRLIAKRASTPADAGGEGGARIQLPPATSNKLPIVYGTSFIGGAITDAMLSTDQQTMWYVVALAEVSDDQGGGGGNYTYDTTKCYYDGKQIQFGIDGKVTGLTTNTSTPQTDTRCDGFLYVYLFTNGSSSGINTGGQTAAQILSTTNGVPAAQAWGANQTMTNCAFAIIKVIFSQDAGTTGVGQLTVNITNSIIKPGDAILDYMLNERYGCGLPLDSIDTTSLTALNTYSDELIDYKPVGWNPGDPYSQQARYRINGPLDTGQSCLNNLQFLVDSADSWLQYSELTGKWKVVINKKYDGYPNISGLFAVDSSNLIGGIEVSPIDLNETYNQIEVAYPNTNIKDQTDYYIIDLFEDDPQLLSANEAINRLNVTLPLVNNAVQARYLAARRIYQSREDLVISFRLDYSGIQLEAGDIIRVTHEVYGWTNKLFRVNNVAETKDDNGNLYADIQAFEYSDQIYDDIVEDYIPVFNTGLSDPNVISAPGTPTVALNTIQDGQVESFTVTSYVPNSGLVLYMDLNYGNNSNVLQHRLYRTIQQSNGSPFTNSDVANAVYNNVNVSINDIPAGNYYFSVTARNNTSGKRSNSSAVFNWTGANINNPVVFDVCNVSSNGNIITHALQSNVIANSFVYLVSGDGILENNTKVAQVISNTQFYTTITPTVPLANACIELVFGGISGGGNGNIQPNAVSYVNINGDANPEFRLGPGAGGSVGTEVPLPVNIANYVGTGNVLPYFINGTTLNANYYYPWAQGTATTANGYVANSTGAWLPNQNANGIPGSKFLILNVLSTTDNWYTLNYYNFTNEVGYPLQATENMRIELVSTWTANQDTIIQLAPYYMIENVAGPLQFISTETLSTFYIPANTPTNIDLEISYEPFAISNLLQGYTSGGYVVKNIVGNTQATCAYQLLQIYKWKE